LIETQREIKEALDDGKRRTGKDLEEIERESKKRNSGTLLLARAS